MSKAIAPSDFGGTLESSYAYHQAELNGHVVVLPKDNELLIDIDSDAAEQLFHKQLTKVNEYVGVSTWTATPSKSGEPERKHIIVQLQRSIAQIERIVLQAVLGSDLRRELLSYCRWTIGDPQPTLFFEKQPFQIAAAPERPLLTEGDNHECTAATEMCAGCLRL
jgi:hypothetical protein